jgi:hypothetical protein
MHLQVVEGTFLLRSTAGDDRGVAAEGHAKFSRHVTQATEAHHAELHVRAKAKALHRGVHGDTSTHEGRSAGEVKVLGNLQHIRLVDDDVLTVAAVGVVSALVVVLQAVGILEGAVVCENTALEAVLFITKFALLAGAAAVYHTTDAGVLTNVYASHFFAHSHHNSTYFVTRNHGENGLSPLFTSLVDVAVADAGKLNLNHDVSGTASPASDRERLKLRSRRERGVRLGLGRTREIKHGSNDLLDEVINYESVLETSMLSWALHRLLSMK